MSRYTVWSVGRDGNVVDDKEFALGHEALERHEFLSDFFGRSRYVGITDNEYPEAGDVSERLAEEVSK